VPGLRSKGSVNRQNVRLGKELIQVLFLCAQGIHCFGVHVWIKCDNPHTKRLCLGHERLCYPTKPDHSQGLIAEAAHGGPEAVLDFRLRILFPDPFPHRTVQLDNLTGTGQDQRHGVIRHFIHTVVGDIGCYDAFFGGSLNIQSIVADPHAHDESASGQTLDDFS